jgi:hypothetical protein
VLPIWLCADGDAHISAERIMSEIGILFIEGELGGESGYQREYGDLRRI